MQECQATNKDIRTNEQKCEVESSHAKEVDFSRGFGAPRRTT